jgi:hypothetical protein
MTDAQLHLAIGLPTLALVLGMMVNGLSFSNLASRTTGLENSMNGRMTSLEARMLALESTMNAPFDLIMGRLADPDTRLSVLDDRSKRP